METIAWIGLSAAGVVGTLFVAIWIAGWLSDPIGRAFAAGLALVALGVWGLLGGIYLLVTNGG